MAVINLATTLASIPTATRGMFFALCGLSTLLFLLRLTVATQPVHVLPHIFGSYDSATQFPWLVIVPGQSFIYPWTILTSAFVETTFTEFFISAVSLPLAGRYLERIWGPVELLRFSAIVIIGSNLISWFLALVQWVVLGSELAVYGTQYHGMQALQTGFLVALAQVIPEHQLQLFKGAVKLRVRDFPMAYVTVSNIACVLGYISPFILIQFGWLISWAYLRFFKWGEGGIRGDRSETFSFVSWFPPFLHTPVTAISNFLYSIFVRLGIVEPWHYSALGDVELGIGSGLGPGGRQGGPGGAGGGGATRAEAERRRAMALKALDQRVAAGGLGAGGVAMAPGASGSGIAMPQPASIAPGVSATSPNSATAGGKSTASPKWLAQSVSAGGGGARLNGTPTSATSVGQQGGYRDSVDSGATATPVTAGAHGKGASTEDDEGDIGKSAR